MRKDTRSSRYYDLLKNDSAYKSKDSLIGWWNFDKNSAGKAEFVSPAGASGSFIRSQPSGSVQICGEQLVETPGFLNGIQHIDSAAITIKSPRPSGFQAFLSSSTTSFAFTFSITFRLLPQYFLPAGAPAEEDQRIALLGFSDTIIDNRFAVIFDRDGGGGSTPGLVIRTKNDAGAGLNATLTLQLSEQELRDWIRLDVVVHNFTKTTAELGFWNGDSAGIWVNGVRRDTSNLSSIAGAVNSAKITDMMFGGLTNVPTGVDSRIQLGEAAIWTTGLVDDEITTLYEKTRSTRNSGVLTNPVRVQLQDADAAASYPIIAGPGDKNRLGTTGKPFNDSMFTTALGTTTEVSYPIMMSLEEVERIEANSSVGLPLLSSPNDRPTISVPATVTTQTAIARSSIINSYLQPNSTRADIDEYQPFDDSNFAVDTALKQSLITDVYPGVSENLGNRVIVDIELSTDSDKILKVTSGSHDSGDPFGDGTTKSPAQGTGLTYFNFKHSRWDNIGAFVQEQEGVAARRNWNLPGYVSGSAVDDYIEGSSAASNDWYYVADSPYFESLHRVPRIFQPYPAIVNQRGAWNSICEPSEFRAGQFSLGKFVGSPSIKSEGTADPVAVLASTVNLAGHIGSWHAQDDSAGWGGAQTPSFEWATWSSDVTGRGFVNIGTDPSASGPVPPADVVIDPDLRKPMLIWNDPADLGTSTFKSFDRSLEFMRTFEATGRPIAYTYWTNNRLFHATGSQLISLSDYINAPMVLEAVEFEGFDLEFLRHQNPHSRVLNYQSGALQDPEEKVARFSNTNNHFDFLTFFLMRQNAPTSGSRFSAQENSNSTRELITWSNHAASSRVMGYEWWDATRRYGIIEAPDDTTRAQPMGGARVGRAFVTEYGSIKDHVPALDSMDHYRLADNSVQPFFGVNGIFCTREETDDMGWCDPFVTMAPLNVPQPRWVTASYKVNCTVPVRVQKPYAQKMTPVFSSIVGRQYDVNNYPSAQQNPGVADLYSNYFLVRNLGGVPISSQSEHHHPSVNFNLHVTPKYTNRFMGTFWPGGTGLREDFLFDQASATGVSPRLHPSQLQLVSGTTGFLYADRSRLNTYDHDLFTLPDTTFYKNGTPEGAGELDKAAATQQDRAEAVISRFSKVDSRLIVKEGARNRRPDGDVGLQRIGDTYYLGGFETSGPRQGLVQKVMNSASFVRNIIGFNQPGGPTLPAAQFFEYSGSGDSAIVQTSGYLLKPEDKLIFGAQYSPADAAHRSFQAISHAAQHLKFITASLGTTPGPATDGTIRKFRAHITAPDGDADPRGPAYNPWVNLDSATTGVSAKEVGEHNYRFNGWTESNDLKNVASASCNIKAGKKKIRLYGTLLRDQRQTYHSNPAQLATAQVHEVIGNHKVLDQYDISTLTDLFSSRMAQVISGSMLPNSYYKTPSDDSRQMSHLSGSRVGRGVRLRLRDKNIGDLGRINYTSPLSDFREFYYDSLGPDVVRMFNADGSGVVGAVSGSLALFYQSPNITPELYEVTQSLGTQLNGVIVTESLPAPRPLQSLPMALYPNMVQHRTVYGAVSVDTPAPNRYFARSFPFEPRYSGIPRRLVQPDIPLMYYIPMGSNIESYAILGQITAYTGSYNNTFENSSADDALTTGFTAADARELAPERALQTGPYATYRPRGAAPGVAQNYDRLNLALYVQPAVEKLQKVRHMTVSNGADDSFIVGDKFRSDFPSAAPGTTTAAQEIESVIQNKFHMTGSDLRTFFGVGDGKHGALDYYYYYNRNYVINDAAEQTGPHVTAARMLVRKPRGYKYGMIAASPTHPKAVFRRDSFGQFRDMLEQRPFTTMFIKNPPGLGSRLNQNFGLRSTAGRVTTAAVTCTFRTPVFDDPASTGRSAQAQPNDTNCCNLSNAMTSSLPFFDGELRNRDSAPATDTDVIIS